MITMVLSQRADGADVARAEWDDLPFEVSSRHGALMQLAREMIFCRVPDQAWRAIGADGASRLHGPSLLRLARLTIAEPDVGRITTRRWKTVVGPSVCQGCQRGEFVFHGVCLACETSPLAPSVTLAPALAP